MKLDKNHALVVLSGGQDSTTCLFWALRNYAQVSTVTFDYGQRHDRELKAASDVWLALAAEALKVRRAKLNEPHFTAVPGVLLSTSPLVSDSELEQYADPESLPGGLEKTFVPMRNQFFMTLASNYAVSIGAGTLVTGVCQEDYGGYPDCRQEFIVALQQATNLGLFGEYEGLTFMTPLMHLSKAESIWLAEEVGAMPALAFSHTSYDGAYPPTGKDHATLLRQKGFTEANRPDPLILRAVDEGLMPMPDRAEYKDPIYNVGLLRDVDTLREIIGG